jgi:hypothetical protein
MPGHGVREATLRNTVGVLTDSTNSCGADVDGSNETHVSALIEDLKKGLDRNLKSIREEMERCKHEQLNAHGTGMMKIPKYIKEMSIHDFNQKHACDLLDLLKNARANASSHSQNINNEDAALTKSVPAGMCGKRDRGYGTPIVSRGGQRVKTPATIRTVPRGQQV